MELQGKKIAFLGDSITEGHGTTAQEFRYPDQLAKMSGCIAYNYGIGGTCYAFQQTPFENPRFNLNFISRIDEMIPDADIVVVFGGTNDFGHGDARFGEFSDRDGTSFYGACHVIYSRLIEKYPDAVIVILTPLHRLFEDYPFYPDGRERHLLSEYVKAEKEVAEYYSLPVLDLYSMSGIQPSVDVIKEKFMPDGLHPSDAGARKIAERLYGFLKAL